MFDKGKARLSVAAPRRAETKAADRAGHNFRINGSTDEPNRQAKPISDFLLTGKENAITMRTLQTVTDLPGRTIRAMIQQERLAGIPICADNASGYYIAADERERLDCARSMRHRAREILRSAYALEGSGATQLDLFEHEGGRTIAEK